MLPAALGRLPLPLACGAEPTPSPGSTLPLAVLLTLPQPAFQAALLVSGPSCSAPHPQTKLGTQERFTLPREEGYLGPTSHLLNFLGLGLARIPEAWPLALGSLPRTQRPIYASHHSLHYMS